MNDNEHALGNIPSFLFATYIFLPEYFPSKIARMQGAIKSKINYYPGLKEGIYLWNRKDLQFNGKNKNTIFIRPEPYTAQYYHGKVNFFDDVLKQIDNKYEVVILPRDKLQEEHYQNLGLINTKIVRGKYKIEEIADKCALFIGAGGSMTREMAVLGFPTICIYQGELLGVDRYLISQGLMLHLKEIDIELIKSIMEGKIKINGDNNKILNKGEQAFNQIIKNISSCGAKVDSGSTVID
jgi:predicted glycosyltransferase